MDGLALKARACRARGLPTIYRVLCWVEDWHEPSSLEGQAVLIVGRSWSALGQGLRFSNLTEASFSEKRD